MSSSSPSGGSPTSSPSVWQATGFALLVVDVTPTSPGGEAKTIRFVSANGSDVRSVHLPDDAWFPTVGGDSVFYISAGHLFKVNMAGEASDLGPLAGTASSNPGWGGLAVRPDGNRWAWSHLDSPQNGTATTLEVGGVGASARVAMHETSPQGPLYLKPVAWSDAGLVVVDQPGNIGGFPLFFDDIYWWHAMLLDPSSFSSRDLTNSQRCPFNDLGGDGSFTCTTRPAGPIQLTSHTGSQRTIDLPVHDLQAGDAFLNPSGTKLAVGVNMTENTSGDHSWDVRTYVLDLGNGAWTRQDPGGSVPYGWLPDGSLVLEDLVTPKVSISNSARLLRTDGTLLDLGPGQYLGALNRTHSVASLASSG